MPVTYLPKICEYLEVSADYILGLSNIKEIKNDTEEDITKKL